MPWACCLPSCTCDVQVFVSTCLFWGSELPTWDGGRVLELALSVQGLERLKDRKVKPPRFLNSFSDNPERACYSDSVLPE